MLWTKESKRKTAMYVDIFEIGAGSTTRESIEKQYNLTQTAKMKHNALGFYYKNDVTAEQIRQQGNRKFEKNQFGDAMEWYNKSLCFATVGGEAQGLAYANRSACFLRMKMFKRCLADIELALQNNDPAKLMKQLKSRKAECLKLMETEEDRGEIDTSKLDFEPNEKFPCMANIVDCRSNDILGRHIVATEDIDVGKTVMVEQTYIGVTQYDHYKSCSICLKEKRNFVPCSKCTSFQFCFDCKGNDLHAIECDMNFGCPAGFKLMDLVRSISLAKNAFTNADELIAFVEDMLNNSDALELPSNLIDQRSKYRAFFKLCADWRKYEFRLPQAFLFYRWLLEQADMKAFFRTRAHGRFLMHLVQHHISMIIRGSFNKRTASIGGEYISDTYVNIVARLLNHSCTPNLCHFFRDGYIKCISIRPIKKNEPLFISYIALDLYRTDYERQLILKSRFVNCKCERCTLRTFESNLLLRLDPDFQQVNKMFNITRLINGLYDRKQIGLMVEKTFSLFHRYERMNWCGEIDHILVILSYLLSEGN